MGAMVSQITSLTIIYRTVYSGTNKRKHQRSASLTFVRGIHRWPANSPHKWPVTRKMFPFDDFIMSDEFCEMYFELFNDRCIWTIVSTKLLMRYLILANLGLKHFPHLSSSPLGDARQIYTIYTLQPSEVKGIYYELRIRYLHSFRLPRNVQ